MTQAAALSVIDKFELVAAATEPDVDGEYPRHRRRYRVIYDGIGQRYILDWFTARALTEEQINALDVLDLVTEIGGLPPYQI